MLQLRERRRDSDVSDILLSPEAYKATQAVEFIAEHLRNEDEYVQVHINKLGCILKYEWDSIDNNRMKVFWEF